MTKISVIVPVYNVENELERCIQSICNQTYKNLEIILVNDGSTDKSGKICDEFAKKDNRIKVIHQGNAGQAAARKVGFQISTGDVVGFVDSDDSIELEMYEYMLKNMIETDAEIVFCDYNTIIESKKVKNKFYISDTVLNNDRAMKLLASNEIPSFMCNKIFKRKILKDEDFLVGKILEDFLCMPDIFLRCKTISYKSNAFYNYFRRENSTMGSKKILFKYWLACQKRLEWFESYFPDYIDLCLNRVVRIGLTCFEKDCLNDYQKNIIKQYFKSEFKCIMKNKQLNLHKKLKVITCILL